MYSFLDQPWECMDWAKVPSRRLYWYLGWEILSTCRRLDRTNQNRHSIRFAQYYLRTQENQRELLDDRTLPPCKDCEESMDRMHPCMCVWNMNDHSRTIKHTILEDFFGSNRSHIVPEETHFLLQRKEQTTYSNHQPTRNLIGCGTTLCHAGRDRHCISTSDGSSSRRWTW
jgi:hypothetical protein